MKKILVIEDEASLRDEVCDMLSFEGYEVLKAENGLIGAQMALEYLPDLVLCDIMMPGLNGHEVLERLRGNDQCKLVPFIFMTALADRPNIRSGMEIGADDYITKPFSREEMLRAITAQIQKSGYIEQKISDDLDDLRTRVILHVPHELLTPLNGIIGYSQMIKYQANTINPEDLKEIAGTIQQSGERLLSLIRHYMIYIQLIAKHKSDFLKEELTNTPQIIKGISSEVASKYNRANDLVLHLANVTCISGKEEFSIMVNELVDNAFKFSQPASLVTITSEANGAYIDFSFHNTGRTFPPDSLAKIGAFMQFDRRKYEQQGSGLGLIISKTIVVNYDGQLSINSDEAEGTTVKVRLPANLGASNQGSDNAMASGYGI